MAISSTVSMTFTSVATELNRVRHSVLAAAKYQTFSQFLDTDKFKRNLKSVIHVARNSKAANGFFCLRRVLYLLIQNVCLFLLLFVK